MGTSRASTQLNVTVREELLQRSTIICKNFVSMSRTFLFSQK